MDTYTRSYLAFPTHTHPTQGIIPFSVVQSLGLCIPFKCYSRCAVRNNQPSRSLSEVPHALDLSSSLPLPRLTGFRPNQGAQQLRPRKGCTYNKIPIAGLWKNVGKPKNGFADGEQHQGEKCDFHNCLMTS